MRRIVSKRVIIFKKKFFNLKMYPFCSLRTRQGKDGKTTTLSIWLWTRHTTNCIESLLKQYLHLLLPILPYRLWIGVIHAILTERRPPGKHPSPQVETRSMAWLVVGTSATTQTSIYGNYLARLQSYIAEVQLSRWAMPSLRWHQTWPWVFESSI